MPPSKTVKQAKCPLVGLFSSRRALTVTLTEIAKWFLFKVNRRWVLPPLCERDDLCFRSAPFSFFSLALFCFLLVSFLRRFLPGGFIPLNRAVKNTKCQIVNRNASRCAILLNLLKETVLRQFLFVNLHQIRVWCVLKVRGASGYVVDANE